MQHGSVSMYRIHKRLLNKLGTSFFTLADNSQDVFWIRSNDFLSHIYVNPAFEKLWDCNTQTLYNSASEWINSVVVEDRDLLRQHYIDCQTKCKSDDSYKIEYRIQGKNNKISWILDSSFPIFDGKECIAFAGVAKDITCEKLQLKEIDNASYFFRSFVEKIHGVFWVKDKSGTKQLYISPSYEKVWGVSCESLYKKPRSWLDYVLPEDIQNSQLNDDVFDLDKNYEFIFRIKRPDGQIRWIKDHHFPISENNMVIGFAGIAEDITAMMLREQELREAKNMAEKANRSKSDFLAMMSHELRTPLNAILGMAQILKTNQLSEEQTDQIDVIAQSGQNLLGLLNDLLDFAKLEVGKLSFKKDVLDIFNLVEKLREDMFPLALKKNLQLQLYIDKKIPKKIVGDAKRLRQILINLISNAIKFTERGYVNINIDVIRKVHNKVTLSFSVEDSGIGIAKQQLKTIFNRFQQIDSVYQRKYDGVGLGLSIVRELVKKMGGSVAVTSELGIGSQFTCMLPFEVRIDYSAAFRELTESIINATGYCSSNTSETYNTAHQFDLQILVVEDNAINQRISKTMLEQIGCHVDIAGCAKEAIDKLNKKYDLVFMDIGLPDMNGFEAVEAIRRCEQPGDRVPIVAMTAHVFEHDRARCFDVGMDDVMAKPIVREELVKVLTRLAA